MWVILKSDTVYRDRSEYRKIRAATEDEIAKQSVLMLKFLKSKHDDSVKSEVIDEDTEVTYFNLENDNPDDHLNLDIDIMRDNDDTVKSGVIDENTEVTDFNMENDNPDDYLNLEVDIIKDNDDTVKSEVTDEDGKSDVTDFNSKMDNSDDNLNLVVEIIKDPAKRPVINDRIKYLLVKNNPLQINLNYYPLDDSNVHYFKTLSNGEKLNRTWLIYSESSDSVFCFCCKLFKKYISSLSMQGTRDWKNISEILKRHENSPNHKIAYEDWKILQTRMTQGNTIDDENQALIRKETKHWKAVIERIISLIQTLGMQNLALRGSSDKLYEFNNGNFFEVY